MASDPINYGVPTDQYIAGLETELANLDDPAGKDKEVASAIQAELTIAKKQ